MLTTSYSYLPSGSTVVYERSWPTLSVTLISAAPSEGVFVFESKIDQYFRNYNFSVDDSTNQRVDKIVIKLEQTKQLRYEEGQYKLDYSYHPSMAIRIYRCFFHNKWFENKFPPCMKFSSLKQVKKELRHRFSCLINYGKKNVKRAVKQQDRKIGYCGVVNKFHFPLKGCLKGKIPFCQKTRDVNADPIGPFLIVGIVFTAFLYAITHDCIRGLD